MCDCKKTEGFSEKLREANALTQSTGELYVVFVLKPLKAVFVCKEADLNDEMGICCYFTPDGTEVLYTPKSNNISVVDAEIVTPTAKQPSKK